jgi:hypothetical protein
MTIDERLEALTQTVELQAAMHKDHEAHFAARQEQIDQRFNQVARNFEVVLDSIKRLENIAGAHEQRLDDLEQHH